MQGYRDWSNRFSNNKACRGRFSIVDGHGFESILRGAMEVECKPSSKHPADEIKNKDDLLTAAYYWGSQAALASRFSLAKKSLRP